MKQCCVVLSSRSICGDSARASHLNRERTTTTTTQHTKYASCTVRVNKHSHANCVSAPLANLLSTPCAKRAITVGLCAATTGWPSFSAHDGYHGWAFVQASHPSQPRRLSRMGFCAATAGWPSFSARPEDGSHGWASVTEAGITRAKRLQLLCRRRAALVPS